MSKTHYLPSMRVVVLMSWEILHKQAGRVQAGSLGGTVDMRRRPVAAGAVNSHR